MMVEFIEVDQFIYSAHLSPLPTGLPEEYFRTRVCWQKNSEINDVNLPFAFILFFPLRRRDHYTCKVDAADSKPSHIPFGDL